MAADPILAGLLVLFGRRAIPTILVSLQEGNSTSVAPEEPVPLEPVAYEVDP